MIFMNQKKILETIMINLGGKQMTREELEDATYSQRMMELTTSAQNENDD